jgi:hypothetical protein
VLTGKPNPSCKAESIGQYAQPLLFGPATYEKQLRVGPLRSDPGESL